LHAEIRRRLQDSHAAAATTAPVADEPLLAASYVAGGVIEAFVEPLAVGRLLPEMPLFIDADRYVSTPLEATYAAAWGGMPAFWRNVLSAAKPEPA